MKARRKAITDLGWSALSTASDALAGFLLLLLVGNELRDASALGGYSVAVNLYVLAGTVFAVGVHVAVVVYGARCGEDREAFSSLVTSALVLALGLGCGGGVLLGLGAAVPAWALRAPTLRVTLPLMAIGFPLSLVNKTLLGVQNSQRRLRALALGVVGRDAVLVGLTWVGLRAGWGLRGAAVAFPVAEAALVGLLALSVRRLFSLRFAGLRSWSWPLLGLGAGSLLATLVSQLAARVDILLVSHLMTQADVGVYSVAALLAGAPALALSAFQRLTTPVLSAYHAAGDRARMGELARTLARVGALFTALCGGVLSLLYPEIVGALYPRMPGLVGAAATCQVLLLGHLFACATVPTGALFTSAGRPTLGAWRTAFGLALNVALNLFLIPRFGLLGAAAGAGLGRAAMAAVTFLLAAWALGVTLWSRALVPLWLAGGAAIALGFAPVGLAGRLGMAAGATAVLAVLGVLLGVLRRTPREGSRSE